MLNTAPVKKHEMLRLITETSINSSGMSSGGAKRFLELPDLARLSIHQKIPEKNAKTQRSREKADLSLETETPSRKLVRETILQVKEEN